jgi:CHAD domain-containing protein
MLSYEPILSCPDKVLELHEMRIAAKRLRYTMEIFAPIYADPASAGAFDTALKAVKQLQEWLGQIHDADVLFPDIMSHVVSLVPHRSGRPMKPGVHTVDLASCEGLIATAYRLRNERDQAYAHLLNDWKTIQGQSVFGALAAALRAADAPGSASAPHEENAGENQSASRHGTVTGAKR